MTDNTDDLTDAERAMLADVARLRERVMRIGQPGAGDGHEVAGLWPEIKSRIERAKVAPIAGPAVSRRRFSRSAWISAGLAAVLIVAAMLRVRRPAPEQRTAVMSAADVTLAAYTDSVRVYQDEAQSLLDRLELQRAMLRPDALHAIDHDLASVDSAIAELREAVARDPRNPALRQLLAESFRRKIDVLQRAGNAG